jgi:hypothetical protein
MFPGIVGIGGSAALSDGVDAWCGIGKFDRWYYVLWGGPRASPSFIPVLVFGLPLPSCLLHTAIELQVPSLEGDVVNGCVAFILTVIYIL